MKPDYSFRNIYLYNCDCMEFMRDIPDKYYELCICDPPYGIGADKKNSDKNKKCSNSATESKFYGNQKWDDNVPTEKYFSELIRVSKQQIIWGVNYYSYPMLTGGRIYWHKNVTMPTYSDGELAYCSLINKLIFFEYTWHGMMQQNMKEKEKRLHPTQKPIQLYKWLLTKYAKEGDKIFDSHGGSFSLACACLDLGFSFDGCEIDKEYFGNAIKRIKNHNQEFLAI